MRSVSMKPVCVSSASKGTTNMDRPCGLPVSPTRPICLPEGHEASSGQEARYALAERRASRAVHELQLRNHRTFIATMLA